MKRILSFFLRFKMFEFIRKIKKVRTHSNFQNIRIPNNNFTEYRRPGESKRLVQANYGTVAYVYLIIICIQSGLLVPGINSPR